jgi:hypothetical protein
VLIFSAILLYFLLYSLTGTVPFYTVVILPFIALFSSYGFCRFSDKIRYVAWRRLLLVVLGMFGTIHFVRQFTYGQMSSLYSRYVSPDEVLEAILQDNGSVEQFTVLSSFETALPISMELAREGSHKNIYVRPLYKYQQEKIADFVKGGGYRLKSRLLGENYYPEVKYLFAMNLDEYKFWFSLLGEEKSQFFLYKVLPGSGAPAYLFKRKSSI